MPIGVEVPEAFLEAGLRPASVLTVCSDCAAKEHLVQGGLFLDLLSQPQGAIFHLGRIAITPGAVAALADARQHVYEFVECHAKGDWGNIGHFGRTFVTEQELVQGVLATDDSAKLNVIALRKGCGQVMSSYRTQKGADLWLLTTLGKHETVVMRPDEY
jgi:hypothetical protein